MYPKLDHAARLFAVLLFVLVSAQLVSAATAAVDLESEPTKAAVTTTDDASPEASGVSCATDPTAGSATVDLVDLDLTEDRGRQKAGSCTHTCPGGIVILCPDRIDHVKSCVNDCCVLTPVGSGSCETHDDCAFPLICNANTNRCLLPV